MTKHVCIECPDCRRYLGILELERKRQGGKLKDNCPGCGCKPGKFLKKAIYFCDGGYGDGCGMRSPDKNDVENCELVHKTMDSLEFEVKQEHLTLIKRFNIKFDQDCEFGAGYIDPKRPYGNSDVYNDIAEMFGIKPEGAVYNTNEDGTEYRKFTQTQTNYLWKLHVEAVQALKICCQTQSFETGLYRRERISMSSPWVKNENSPSVTDGAN